VPGLTDLQKQIDEYRKQLAKGDIQAAYTGIMRFFDQLRLQLKEMNPDYFLSDVTYGCMDYTYLYYFPLWLKQRKLKITLFFEHNTFEFHIWLSGYNKAAQAVYLKQFKAAGWQKYPLAAVGEKVDYIADFAVVTNPDFGDLDALAKQLMAGLAAFTADVEAFLKGAQMH
jgi:hypothetical protein